MAKRKNDYWSKRFRAEEAYMRKKADIKVKMIVEEYEKSLSAIEKDISNWYSRLMNNNNISLTEARKRLNNKELKEFKWTVEEYISYGRKNAISGEFMKDLENASARYHISKLEALEVEIKAQINFLYEKLDGQIEQFLINTYKDNYYRSAFTVQKGLKIGSKISALNPDMISKVIKKPWLADKTFSMRLWGDRDSLINTLHTELSQIMIRGEGYQDAINKISRKFNVKKTNAVRLVYTESAAYQSSSRKQCFNDLGIEKYRIIATLDMVTSELCRSLDKKVFKMSEYVVGVTANPFHPNCRTTTAPYFEDDKGYRAARSENGKTYYVPDDMGYKEWFEKFVS